MVITKFKPMQTVAILTGDIIQSRKLENLEIDKVIKTLNHCFKEIQKLHLSKPSQFEWYRGDSFQMIIEEPEQAIKIAIIIRAQLRSLFISNQKNTKGVSSTKTDARISIGIGSIRRKSKKLAESQGQAFELSGMEFDKMKKENIEFAVNTPWIEINEEFKVNTLFTNSTIKDWSPKTSESIFRFLLYKEKQEELASKLKISQPAVSKRLYTQGNMKAIEAMILRFEQLIVRQQKQE